MSRLFLIRHGATAANEQFLYCGATDLPLSEEGAAELREKRRRGGYPEAGGLRLVTSGLRRTEETLEILFGLLSHEAEPRLREISFGIYEMKSYYQLEKDEQFLRWLQQSDTLAPEGGESGQEMRARVLEGFRALAQRDEDTLAVCHGGPIAAIMAQLFPEEDKNRYDWQPANGEGYELEMRGGKAVSYRKIPQI